MRQGNPPKEDPSLQDPQCVFQLLKTALRSLHRGNGSRRSPGCPKEETSSRSSAKPYAATGQAGKAGTILYAMGQTQHTVGSQNVRIMAMLQLLLGNIGLPGGGVNALRGESNVQGSTDMGVLYHQSPAISMLRQRATSHLRRLSQGGNAATSYWTNKPKFLVSLLKAWWGDAATRENNFCYDYSAQVGS